MLKLYQTQEEKGRETTVVMSTTGRSEVWEVPTRADSCIGHSVLSGGTIQDHAQEVRSIIEELRPSAADVVVVGGGGEETLQSQMQRLRANLGQNRVQVQQRAKAEASSLDRLPKVAWHLAFVSVLDRACQDVGFPTHKLFPPTDRDAASAVACKERLLRTIGDVGRLCAARMHGGGGHALGSDGVAAFFKAQLATAAPMHAPNKALADAVGSLGVVLDSETAQHAQHVDAVFSSSEQALAYFAPIATAAAQRARRQDAALKRHASRVQQQIAAMTSTKEEESTPATPAAAVLAACETASVASKGRNDAAVKQSVLVEKAKMRLRRQGDILHTQLQRLAEQQLRVSQAKNSALASLGEYAHDPRALAAAEAHIASLASQFDVLQAKMEALSRQRSSMDSNRTQLSAASHLVGGSLTAAPQREVRRATAQAATAVAKHDAALETFRAAMTQKLQAETDAAARAIIRELWTTLSQARDMQQTAAQARARAFDSAFLAHQRKRAPVKTALLQGLAVVGGGGWKARMLHYAKAQRAQALTARIRQHVTFLHTLFAQLEDKDKAKPAPP